MDNTEIKIKPYLSYAEIQQIVNEVVKHDEWAERELVKDIMTICYATGMSKKEVDKYGHDELLNSGLIEAIRDQVRNYWQIEEAIKYTESVSRSLCTIVKELPKTLAPLKKVIDRGSKSSK